jgi:hypothetical protein
MEESTIPKNWRVVVLGCTHGLHNDRPLEWWPDGDLLLVCGDLLQYDPRRHCLQQPNPWYDVAKKIAQVCREKPYKLGALVTCGNHDTPACHASGSGYLAAMRAFANEGVALAVDELVRVQDPSGNFIRVFASPLSTFRGNRSCAFQAHRSVRSDKERAVCERNDPNGVLPKVSAHICMGGGGTYACRQTCVQAGRCVCAGQRCDNSVLCRTAM